ncbi:hypothetical protein [Pseudoduganella sp. OTU4001]|uniref:hypothetical protein n=1 Tax=Pseudoduganella sp. OTU4001 TaxID=3043854 RepID=UPI00313CB0A2
MGRPDKSSKDTENQQNFVLVDTEHPEINSSTIPEGQVRRADRPLPGNRQSATESGSRQGGSTLGTEGGAPGPDASSGV